VIIQVDHPHTDPSASGTKQRWIFDGRFKQPETGIDHYLFHSLNQGSYAIPVKMFWRI
jgi:hypothetical protein